MKPTARFALRPLAGLAVVLTAACSGDGHGPASPNPVISAPATMASIAGAVVSVPAGSSRGGIRVTLDEPRLETATDASGSFRFDGVVPGTRTMVFQSSAISATLAVSGVSAGETRSLSVALTQSSASESDDSNDDSDDEDGCPSNGNGDGCDDGDDHDANDDDADEDDCPSHGNGDGCDDGDDHDSNDDDSSDDSDDCSNSGSGSGCDDSSDDD